MEILGLQFRHTCIFPSVFSSEDEDCLNKSPPLHVPPVYVEDTQTLCYFHSFYANVTHMLKLSNFIITTSFQFMCCFFFVCFFYIKQVALVRVWSSDVLVTLIC